jgi:ribose transport system permease protein
MSTETDTQFLGTDVEVNDEELTEASARSGFRRALPHGTAFWMAIAVLLLCVVFSLITPSGTFLSVSDFQSMGRDAAESILLATGMTFMLGAGLLDLSIGANLVMASVVGGLVVRGTASHSDVTGFALLWPSLLGAAAAIGSGAAFGLINGLLVTVAKVNAFIATLATMGIAAGMVLVITGGADVANIPENLQDKFGIINVADIPVTILIIAPIVAVVWIATRKTTFGIRTLAIGSDEEAARRAGISFEWHVLLLFVLMGTLAGVAGFLDILQLGSSNILGHTSDALAAIAAAVIGGTSLFGGRMSIGGSVAGALIPIVLGTGLVIYGLSSYYQQVVVGGVLLVAVYTDQRRRTRRQ